MDQKKELLQKARMALGQPAIANLLRALVALYPKDLLIKKARNVVAELRLGNNMAASIRNALQLSVFYPNDFAAMVGKRLEINVCVDDLLDGGQVEFPWLGQICTLTLEQRSFYGINLVNEHRNFQSKDCAQMHWNGTKGFVARVAMERELLLDSLELELVKLANFGKFTLLDRCHVEISPSGRERSNDRFSHLDCWFNDIVMRGNTHLVPACSWPKETLGWMNLLFTLSDVRRGLLEEEKSRMKIIHGGITKFFDAIL